MSTPTKGKNMTTSTDFHTVCVIGLGYIGLPTAAFIASKGVEVIGVDVNQNFVDRINAGEVPFFEPDFEATLAEDVRDGLLTATTETPRAEAYIVAVPTPFNEQHALDDTFIKSAAEKIAPQLTGGEIIVLESTSPPGTTESLADYVISLRPDLTLDDGQANSIYFAHCPERVLPGKIMEEMAANDRMIGGLTPHGTELARNLYGSFATGELLLTDAKTAEMAKLTENSFRDVNIAFANELSVICDRLGIDVWELIELANHHPRVNILQPGPGVGGHCIAVDPWFIVAAAPEEARLIRAAREINDDKPEFVLEKVLERAERFKKPVIAALGIAFKPDIDDLRESPSLGIVEKLASRLNEGEIRVVEPHIETLPPRLQQFDNVQLDTVDSALEVADIVLVLVDHTLFKSIDREVLDGKAVIDTRGLWR